MPKPAIVDKSAIYFGSAERRESDSETAGSRILTAEVKYQVPEYMPISLILETQPDIAGSELLAPSFIHRQFALLR